MKRVIFPYMLNKAVLQEAALHIGDHLENEADPETICAYLDTMLSSGKARVTEVFIDEKGHQVPRAIELRLEGGR